MSGVLSEDLNKRIACADMSALFFEDQCKDAFAWQTYKPQWKPKLLTDMMLVGTASLAVNAPAQYTPLIREVLLHYPDPYLTLGAEQFLLGLHDAIHTNFSLRADLARLRLLGQSNWDGEGAEPISGQTIATAEDVVAELFSGVIHHPTIAMGTPTLIPMPDGSVLLKWIVGERELAITLCETTIEVQRWHPASAYSSEGLWEVNLDQLAEHFDWLRT